MKSYFLLVLSFLLYLFPIHAEDKNTKLRMIQPNWRFEVKERFLNGTPKVLLFFAPVAGENRENAVKQIVYNPNNSIANETDLIQLSSPGNPILFHGPQIHYDRKGAITRIVFYNQGEREGQMKLFYPSGVLKSSTTYHANQLEGLTETYYENGRLKERFSYLQGKHHGEYERFYSSGARFVKVNYVNGLLNGLYQEWYDQGVPKAEFHYLKGLLNNEGNRPAVKRYYEDRSVHEMQSFLLGVPHGEHLIFYPNGKVKYKALYKKGVLEGKPEGSIEELTALIETMPDIPNLDPNTSEEIAPEDTQPATPSKIEITDGEHKEYFSLQEGQADPLLSKVTHFENGKLHGEQRAYYPNGQLKAIFNYHQGILNGTKKYWNEDGLLIQEATYDQGLLTGRFYVRNPDGTEHISHYKNNQLHGLHEIYYSADPFFGRVKAMEAYYEQGRLEGEMIKYNPAGTKTLNAMYHQGYKEGLSLFYTDEGRLILSAEFKEDLQHGITRKFYSNGKIEKESLFFNGEKTGEEKGYHENGKLASLKKYKHGNFDGLCQEWNKDGVLIFEGEYANGIKNGKFNKYDDKGQPVVLQVYKEDQLIEKKSKH